MKIAGTKLFEHDASVFILDPEKKEVFAISAERITRIKHDPNSIKPILNILDKSVLNDIKYVVHSFTTRGDKDYFALKIREEIRKIYKPRYISELKNWHKLPKWKKIIKLIKHNPKSIYYLFKYWYSLKYKNKPNPNLIENYVKKELFKNKNIIFEQKDHHLCHAASAYYFSPFNNSECIVFTLDGKGDGKQSTLWIFNGTKYDLISYTKVNEAYNLSIGKIYGKFTKVLGFTPNSDEGKTEALAAYGKPNEKLYEILSKCYTVDKKNLCWVENLDILKKLDDEEYLMKWKEKIGNENFAATIQRWLEDTVVEFLRAAYERYKIPRLAMAGGVVANVIMNLNIFERTPFEEVYIFPAMGDDGTAAGAAVLKAMELGYDVSWLKDMEMPYWGPSYSKEDIEKELKKEKWKNKIEYEYIGDTWPELAAEMIANGKIIAIFQGKMEFGPRALGNRSILADPRDPKTRDKINSTVKRRPWFQPFCPSVLEEERKRLFEKSYKHKHMAIAFKMKKEYWDKLPSAIHIDGTARPQFVEEKDNPNYYRILKKFKELTGYGIIVNTSFNLHGRTIVRTPEDALTDFVDCNIDALFIEGYLVKSKK